MLPNDLPPRQAVYQQSPAGWTRAVSKRWCLTCAPSFAQRKGARASPCAMVVDGRTLQSSCESGPRAGYVSYKRKRGSKVHMAVDTLGHLLAMYVTPADGQERAQVHRLCEDVQQATGHTVQLAWGLTRATRVKRYPRQRRATALTCRS